MARPSRTHRATILTAAALAAAVAGVTLGTTAQAAPAGTPAPRALGTLAVDAAGLAELAPGAAQAVAAQPAGAAFGAGQALTATRALADGDGTTHVRMTRTYRGLPVLGGDLVVHRAPDGTLRSVSQTLRAPLRLSTTPTVTPASASGAAAARLGAGRSLTRGDVPSLVVDATSATPRLVWAVRSGGTQPDGTPSRLTTYVDATTGAVVRSEEGIQTVDGQGTGLYTGTVPLQLTLGGSTYQLKDATRGGTYTTDMAGKQDSYGCQLLGIGCSTGTLFTSATPSFGNGSSANRATAGVDAQYGTDVTWDFYKNTYGRNGIFGTGKGSFNRVHYGKNYVNAFWDGTKMTYGDGDGKQFGPLVSLDVTGHEMSHGVTENSAGLTYSGESGGLNEATSDIFGTMVEFSAANPKQPGNYLIGEAFDSTHQGFRRMDDPAKDGASLSCYGPTAPTVDVHYSSGIGNHFFYLLSEGSGTKTVNGFSYSSPVCQGGAVTGIGRDAASAIWYRALTVYMTSKTDYRGARAATVSAASDLYGASSAQVAAVKAAWTAVAVG
ncbi:M4 family metallopeptidase [Lapillicoccus jejuensis]|uniref:Neutral metalloproteinase n=1 Tax=Lapillicoccus jejuensis TaxID=402171 RepID=A0A542DX96_9MICO|nr:M4 family metallopeptidase [Lapillicoccus jejuensis]TQJ07713.1 griselysin [Lapillicoccus jejuensis]